MGLDPRVLRENNPIPCGGCGQGAQALHGEGREGHEGTREMQSLGMGMQEGCRAGVQGCRAGMQELRKGSRTGEQSM